MTPFAELLQQGSTHAWLFIPTAIVLGALHGLEPGHSKTMMAAFIIAIRGTVRQAVLLGLCATLSHTAIVWVIALGGMTLWRGLNAEKAEPYFQMASGAIVVGMALWMLWRTRREQRLGQAGGHGHGHDRDHRHSAHGHDHSHDHDHAPHDHGPPPGVRLIETDHGDLALELFEDAGPPRWRLHVRNGPAWRPDQIGLETERPDGARQTFGFVSKDGRLESVEAIPEPHDFIARLTLTRGQHAHAYDVAFTEDAHGHGGHHGDDPIHRELRGLDLAAGGYQDAHELAHADDIRRRFADRDVTTGQIVVFGLTGGLIPCPGAITVLMLCLQLKKLALGATLVSAFSVGLALTMVTAGVVAALSVREAARRWSGFGEIVRKAPYVSGLVILVVGLVIGVQGWLAVARSL